MRYLILSLVFIFSGCASVPTTGYISRVDHAYDRQIYAGFDKITSAMIYVLRNKGWTITEEDEPEVFERDDRYDNNGYRNLLIITDFKKKAMHLTSTHLNIFIHTLGNTSNVEIRYEAKTSLVHQFTTVKNDQLAQSILDAVEEEVNR